MPSFIIDASMWGRALELGVIVLIGTSGTAGNLLVLTSILTDKALRTKSNVFVFNLAVADLLVCAVLEPFYFWSVFMEREPPGCQALGYLQVMSVQASVLTLGAIAIHRYILVTKATSVYRHWYTRRNMALIIASIWSLTFILQIPTFLGLGRLGYNARANVCNVDYDHPGTLLYAVIATTISITIPVTTSGFLYVRLVRFLRQKVKVASSLAQDKRELRVTVSLIIIFVAFLACCLPSSFIAVIDMKYRVPDSLQRMASHLIFFNSCVNPFIYAWRSHQFRTVFVRIFTCRPANNQVHTSEPPNDPARS